MKAFNKIGVGTVAAIGLFVSSSFAQVGSDNPTGVAGEFNGQITTGCSYDPYTGNAKRSITDIVVAGAVGAYPLAFTRTSPSRYIAGFDNNGNGQNADFGGAGNWVHSYQWAIDATAKKISDGKPKSFTVRYPDGRVTTFRSSSTGGQGGGGGGGGDPYFRGGPGIRDRLQVVWDSSRAGRAFLIMPDGGTVNFAISIQISGSYAYYTYQLKSISDPYGQTTTISGSPSTGLVTITEPGGRWIQLYYTQNPIDPHVFILNGLGASDGRTVQYGYTVPGHTLSDIDPWLSQVTYFNDPTLVATYTYTNDNTGQGGNQLLSTAVDPMYSGPMWKIGYKYATGLNADNKTGTAYGQILSENYYNGTTIGAAVSTLSVNNTNKTRTETRGDGKTRTFTYNTTPLLTNWTDFKGNGASQTYDSNGYVNAVTDFNNHTTNFTKDNFTGRLLTTTFPSTPGDTPPNTPRGVVTYTYGSASCADPNNRDSNNPYYVCTSTDEGGHTTTYTRDTSKRATQINYPDGGTESFQYNSFGQITSHGMRTGGTETFSYDARGLKQTYRDAYHAGGNPSMWYQYDSLDRILGITDALGSAAGDTNHTTSFSYNSRGQTLVITLPVDSIDSQRHTITNTYNTNGTLASMTDQLGHMASYTYDDYKRLRTITTPPRSSGDTMYHTNNVYYDANGTGDDYTNVNANVTHATSPGGKKTTTVYDENLRKISVTVAVGTSDAATTTFRYDLNGNLTSVIPPKEQPGQPFASQSATTAYDERNRPYLVTDPLGNPTSCTYDAAGHKKTITRANGQLTTLDSYDAMNRLLQQTVKQTPDPDAVTKYTYYTSGLLHTMQDPHLVANGSSEAYTYQYDSMGRKTTLTYPRPTPSATPTSESWHYDAAGRVDTFTNRNGNTQRTLYDNLNRAYNVAWDDSGVTPTVTFGYDVASRIISINNANANISHIYFDDGLLNSETTIYADNTPRTVTYYYDADGNRAGDATHPGIQYPNAVYAFNYGYTGRNQLNDVNNFTSGANVAHFVYDLDGNLNTQTRDNSTTSSYICDGLDRVTHIGHVLNGTTRTFDYAYDSVGNRKSVKRDGGTGDVFGYDLADQSTSILLNVANPDTTSPGAQTISYDANGNRMTVSAYGPADTYTTNNLNQYTQRNSAIAGYDTNGNMTSGLDSSAYSFDAQSRILTASKGGTTDTFKYDGLNRQVSRQIGAAPPVYNVYDGWNLIAEYAAGSTVPSNAYLSGTGGLVKNLVNNRYYYQDASSSTSHLADGAGGLLEWYRYDLQGTPIFSGGGSSSAFGVRHLFTGQQWYSELGLYDLRNRFYSPDTGRFLQADPVGFAGDRANLYRYVNNNPQKWRDRLGLGNEPKTTFKIDCSNCQSAQEVNVTGTFDLWAIFGTTYTDLQGGNGTNGIELSGVGDALGGDGNLSGIGNAAGPFGGDIPSFLELGQATPTPPPLFAPLPPAPGITPTPIPTLPPNPFSTPSTTPTPTNIISDLVQTGSQCSDLPFNQCQDCARQAFSVAESQKDPYSNEPVFNATERQLLEYNFQIGILNETLCGPNPSQYGH